jgi:2-polyprenyl-6-methoxyphenol hydroxylase-like FAD-dependent oxidoreductase
VTDQTDILVVGAGPTGLALALQARAGGATVRVLERRAQAWRPSRALLVHARTFEVLRPLGVVDALLSQSRARPEVVAHFGARRVVLRVDAPGLSDSPYPYVALARQADIEATLSAALAGLGVEVERGVTVTGLDQHPIDGVWGHTQTTTGTGTATSRYLIGCDGAASTVRSAAGLRWSGHDYPAEVVLADVELEPSLPPDALHVAVGRAGLVFVFPGGEKAAWRLLATRPAERQSTMDFEPGELGPPLAAGELDRLLSTTHLDVACRRVAWSSRVRVAHRLADSYRSGSVFLAGDAAHVHSPAGGQGMNVGIQDATNLGWKLAYAALGSAGETLLDSYEQERQPVERLVSAWTDLVFWLESARDPVASLVRLWLAPVVAPWVPLAARPRWVLAHVLRTLGGLRVNYRSSPLSVQRAGFGRLRAGDRLPDATVSVDHTPVRLHELTARPGLHVLLRPCVAWPYPDRREIHVHRLDGWGPAALTVVRPDGYIGLCSDVVDEREIAAWLRLVGLAPSPA